MCYAVQIRGLIKIFVKGILNPSFSLGWSEGTRLEDRVKTQGHPALGRTRWFGKVFDGGYLWACNGSLRP